MVLVMRVSLVVVVAAAGAAGAAAAVGVVGTVWRYGSPKQLKGKMSVRGKCTQPWKMEMEKRWEKEIPSAQQEQEQKRL